MRIANRNARDYVQRLEEFQGNNIHGVREGEFYVVYSYEWWPILAYSYEDSSWFANADKYSPTTSRHLSICRPYGVNVQEITKLILESILKRKLR